MYREKERGERERKKTTHASETPAYKGHALECSYLKGSHIPLMHLENRNFAEQLCVFP